MGCFLLFVWKCPILFFLGIPCPGCGTTRACKSLLHFQIKEAFIYNPVFPLIIILFLYAVHRSVLVEKWRDKWNHKLEIIMVIVLVSIIMGVYVYRLVRQNDPVMQLELEKGLLYKIINALK